MTLNQTSASLPGSNHIHTFSRRFLLNPPPPDLETEAAHWFDEQPESRVVIVGGAG